jgi:plasmid stabilization system protein ParE
LNVHLSAAAKRDLRQTSKYLDRETGDPDVADRLYDEIQHVLQLIGDNPLMGREWAELSKGLRGFPCGDYMIFWRVKRTMVQITRIMHQKQDIARAFRPRDAAE